MKNKFYITILFLLNNYLFFAQNSQFVNVFIGTDGTGHTFPGASMPFGMVQPSPDNQGSDWAYTSGYQFKDSTVLGFSQTHFSGTGIGEMGDILLLPFGNETDKNILLKNTEKASVGYYSVTKKDKVKVELTASNRVAFHRYSFPNRKAKVFLNCQHGLRFLTDSLVLDSKVLINNNKRISGYCHTKNWVERKYFFIIEFDTPFNTPTLLPKDKKENAPKYILDFDLAKNKQLQVKIALSTVNTEGSLRNLETEIPHWNFEKVKKNAEKTWDSYLNRIEIDGNIKQKQIFYTSLYHLLLQPSNIADVDGQYRGADDKTAFSPDKTYYSTLSIWDIYRGAFPLLQIIAPEKIDGIVNSLLLHHKAAGFLPIWTAWGQDNYCMIGNHAIPMLASAYKNGFTGFDKNAALQAMIETETKKHINSDWDLYNKYGYYPFDKLDNEAVSRTLESSVDDWCVAEMARDLGDIKTTETFTKRANYYKNLYDSATKQFRGRDTKGNFRTPFDPLIATSPMNNPGDYTEANAWQYFWTPAQFDIEGVINLLGGKENFTKQLNTFFTTESPNQNKFLGQEAMIGQYAHGNEPSHHILYLYAFSNTPKTGQLYIHKVINEFHNNTPNGMIGNDDCGQMSAWYILSSLGFYPVNAASGAFVLGTPQYKKAIVHLAHGKTLKIEAHNLSDKNIFSDTIYWNEQKINTQSIDYNTIMKGGNLKFDMTNN